MKAPRPVLFLYWHEYHSMPEYAYTVPTGIVSGKMWRRRSEELLSAMYVGQSIIWFDVVLRHGPQPPNFRPPDWHNYKEWKKQWKIQHQKDQSTSRETRPGP